MDQVPIAERDWHQLECRVRAGSDVSVKKAGTFGVASASDSWSWVSSALGRLSRQKSCEHMAHAGGR